MASEVEGKPKRKSRPSRWKKRPDAPAVAPVVKLKPQAMPVCGKAGCEKLATVRVGYPSLGYLTGPPEHRRFMGAFYCCMEHSKAATLRMAQLVREDGFEEKALMLESLVAA